MFLCVKIKLLFSGSRFFVCFFCRFFPGSSGRRFAVCGRYQDQQRRCGRTHTGGGQRTDPGIYAGEYELSVIKKDGSREVIRGEAIDYQVALTDDLDAILKAQNEGGGNPALGRQFTSGSACSLLQPGKAGSGH